MTKFKVLIILVYGIFYFTNIKGQIIPEWATSFNENYPIHISGSDMIADNFGNVYVIGYSQDTAYNGNLNILKYDSYGYLEWVRTIDSLTYFVRIATDDSSNLYIAGNSSDYGFVTIKYNSFGTLKWTKSYSNGGYWNWAFDIVTDDSNSVYITGISGIDKFTTLKYDRNGNLDWVALDSSSIGLSNSYITIDNYHNIYVAGRGGDTSYNCNTYKYNNLGEKQWERIYSGNYTPGGAHPSDIKCDNNGNVYVLAATTNNNQGEGDYSIVKYDTNGNQIWASIYSADSYYDDPIAMVVDKNGNVYATGNIHPGNCPTDAFATIKVDSTGVLKWIKTYSRGYCNWDIPIAIKLDTIEYIYVSGQSPDSIGHEYFTTIKYDTDGNEVWVAHYSHVLNSNNVPNSMCLDNNGNIYVSGSYNCQNSSGILTIKYGHNVGITELLDNNNYNVFPNPFENFVTFTFERNLKNADLLIYDIQGRVVQLINELNKSEFTVKRSNLTNGMYFYRLVENNKDIARGKIIAK